MREKESQEKDGYPNMPQLRGNCAICGNRAMSYQEPIVCIKHVFEPANCDGCPGRDCSQCREYEVNVYRKFLHGGWRP